MITNDPYGISRACAPWKSLDALETSERKRYVLTEQERRCFACPHRDCVDGCKGARPRVVNLEDLRRMNGIGLTDSAISRVMGVSVSTVYYHRKKLGLPPNATGRPRREASK